MTLKKLAITVLLTFGTVVDEFASPKFRKSLAIVS